MFKNEQVDELGELAKPLIKWLNENGNPYSQIVIEVDAATLYSGEMSFVTDEFVKD